VSRVSPPQPRPIPNHQNANPVIPRDYSGQYIFLSFINPVIPRDLMGQHGSANNTKPCQAMKYPTQSYQGITAAQNNTHQPKPQSYQWITCRGLLRYAGQLLPCRPIPNHQITNPVIPVDLKDVYIFSSPITLVIPRDLMERHDVKPYPNQART
jgi:hypothetical protein